jgi:hypothetical protein
MLIICHEIHGFCYFITSTQKSHSRAIFNHFFCNNVAKTYICNIIALKKQTEMKKLFLSSALLATLFACSKKDDKDVTAPVIEKFTANNKTQDVTVKAGDEVHIDFKVTDNKELREIKIDLHDAFDGHTHGGRTNSFVKFATVKVYALSGTRFEGHEHIDIASNALAGPYHVMARALDKEGNQSALKEIEGFIITNDHQAKVKDFATVPAKNNSSNEIDVTKGGTIKITAVIEDTANTGTKGLEEIEIYAEEKAHSHGRVAHEKLFEKEIKGTSLTNPYSLNETFPIPANAEHGDYKLVIKVIDKDGNITLHYETLHVE